MKIKSIFAREILDSRGTPTVEVDVTIETQDSKPETARGAAPSGASTGAYEAMELRDGEKRYLGKGVQNAVENVNKKIAKALVGKNLKDQKDADERMLKLDGTENKSKLGANAIVATSMAIARAFAKEQGKEYFEFLGGKKLPQPMFNILNGGKHAGGKLAIQEFMIIPKGKTFSETLQMASEIYHILGKQLSEKYGASARNVGDEGGFAPPMDKCEDAIIAIVKAIEEAGYTKETKLAFDIAASSFYDGVKKTYALDEEEISKDMLMDYYIDLVERYPTIASIEDPFQEDDFNSFSTLTNELEPKVMIVGDDLLVTNPKRIQNALKTKACNALLLKVNQIGTVSEAIDAAKLCRKNNWKIAVSHRSGETEDTFIADLAVGINAEFIKTGSLARSERTAKYNQLLRIEEKLTDNYDH
ncbi:phosphopyruvate hydratase [Candidatus Micrarchaeota archaeon]|nr:phosphopyruvate hydratase [Candidatus Micrarchaeota archaeon]